jgi:hypothetical protein
MGYFISFYRYERPAYSRLYNLLGDNAFIRGVNASFNGVLT